MYDQQQKLSRYKLCMRMPMTGVQSRKMLNSKKNKRIHEQKKDFYIYKKKRRKDLNQSVFSIKDVRINNCSRIDNNEWILLNL